MATVNFIPCKSQCRASLRSTLDYVQQDKKCVTGGMKLISGKDCYAETAYQEFMSTKNSYGKANGRFFYHYTQSFSPEENITPAQAHQAALKLAEHYDGFEVLVATHCDAEHIHSHLVINSVGFADGKKLRQNPHTLEELRGISDGICREIGLSTLQPYEQKPQAKTVSTREFRAAEKGDSWKFRLMSEIDAAMQTAYSPADFTTLIKRKGYGVRWEAGRKSITYTTPEGKKCRDNRLHEAKYLKERMELEFGFRATQAQKQQRCPSLNATISADYLRDPEAAVGSHAGADDGEFALHGHPGNRRKYCVLLSGDGEISASADGKPEQSPAGNLLTGWEDERAKLQMGQGFGALFEEPDGAESGRFADENDLDDGRPERISEQPDDLADVDSEVNQWQLYF